MYVRPDSRRKRTQIPENYGGVAFSNERDGDVFIPPPTDAASCCEECDGCDECEKIPVHEKAHNGMPSFRSPLFGLNGEDLLLIGLILLLSQSDLSNDIVPILIILLLC